MLVLLAALAVFSLTSCTVTPKGEEAPPSASQSSAPSASPSPNADDLYNDTEAKDAILTAVEALVSDDYKGQSYSCDVLTYDDDQGARYVVSLQIDVSVEPPESTEIINGLVDAINGLGDSRISEIEIMAVKDMQIVDSNMDLDLS